MKPNEKNPLKAARKKLYTKKNQIGDLRRIKLKKRNYDVDSAWGEEKKEVKKEAPKKVKKPMTFYTKFFIFSFSFFLISVLAALFIFNSGANQITYEKVNVGVQGPNYISGGDTISFIVSVNNQNSVPIVLSDVYVIYPQGTVEPGSPTITMSRDRQSFEKILPGGTEDVRFKAVIFGSEGETKKIQVRYEYRVENSNAIFHKDKDYDIRISTAPINITSEHPTKILSGEEIEVEIDIASNSTEDVSNLGLKVDYPFGFVYESAIPEPVSGNNIWDIGTILAAGNKVVKVKGVIGGQNGEDRVFRYSVGSKDEEDLSDIGSVFSSSESIVTIKKPDIGVKILVDGSDDEVSGNEGEFLSVELGVTNNLQAKILNPNITVELKGEVIDERQIEVDNGFYDSRTNSIIWSKQASNNFNNLEKGETRRLTFKVKIKESLEVLNAKDPLILFDVKASGESFNEDGGATITQGSNSKTVKLNSELVVLGKTFYNGGAISSEGPIPPKVGETTNYTIYWETKSSTNDLSDVKISAILPPYVKYLGVFTPSNMDITFDENRKEVVWDVGKVPASSGFSEDPVGVYFKVEIEPSLSQVGTAVNLLNDKRITGIDTFTGKIISITGPGETTKADEDGFGSADSRVIE